MIKSEYLMITRVLKKSLRLNGEDKLLIITDSKNMKKAEMFKNVSDVITKKADITTVKTMESYKDLPKFLTSKFGKYNALFFLTNTDMKDMKEFKKIKLKKKVSSLNEVEYIMNPKPRPTLIEELKMRKS